MPLFGSGRAPEVNKSGSFNSLVRVILLSDLMPSHYVRSLQEQDAGPSLTPSRPAPPVPRVDGTSRYANNARLQQPELPDSRRQMSELTHNRPFYDQDAQQPRMPTPEQAGSAQTIVKRGWVSVKEDGLRAWIWSKRWLVLREESLSFHKNDVRSQSHPR